jgi:hypothetical protein
MKKMTKLFSILALLLCVVSCQISNVDNGVLTDNGLKVTAVIDNSDATRLNYDVDNTAYTITPTWKVGDQIIGMDDKNQAFTFTVESVSEGVATLNPGTYAPTEAHELFAFYAPGVTQSDFGTLSLNVPLNPQTGVLDDEIPVVLSAKAEINNGVISLTFTKQTAIVGLKKFKLPKQATITSMELNGVSTGLVFTWDYQGMRVASSNEIGAIHLKGNWETDAEGVCTTPVYFAVAPQKNANISLSMSTGAEQFVNVNTIAKLNIEAGYYYHMTKEMGGPAVTVNGAGFASLEEAFTAASALPGPVTITLQKDVTPTGLCNFSNAENTSTNILDLNGHNITTSAASLINVKDCNLTLTDGSTDNPAEWGTISTTTAAANTNYVVTISGENGRFTMLRGNITSSVCRCLTLTAGPTVTLTGGKIESSVGVAVGIGSSGGTLYVAGDIKLIGSGNVVYLWGGEATFTGGFISNAKASAPIYVAGTSVATFNDGYIKTTNLNTVASTGEGTAYVTGGYHSCAVRDVYAKDATQQYVNILNPDDATAEEYPYKVVPMASNPTVATTTSGTNVWNHGELESALKQSDIRSKNTAETTLKLQADITSTTTIKYAEPHKYLINVDLNGHTITSSALPAIQFQCPATITDGTGEGEVITTGAIAVRSTANLTINGGSFVAAKNLGSTAIEATDTCHLVINNGYFYGDDAYDVRKSGENASITISGGRFRKALDAATIAEGCQATAEELVYNGRTYGYKVAAAAVVAVVNGTGYATMAAAVAAANSIPADGGRASIILQEDIANVPRFTLNNSNLPLALDLNGHTLSSTDSVLITVENASVTITDSGLTKGKITTTQQKALLIKAGGEVSIANCTIESTKAKGSSFSEPCVYVNGSGAQLTVNNGTKICTTDSLTCVRVYTGSLTVNGGEITSGINSAGWYCVVSANTATTVINGGSFYTSGRGNASTCHIAASGASVTVNGGYFHSAGRCASSGNSEYGAKMVLKGGYFTGVKSASVAIEEGKAWTELDPKVTHVHETTGATLEYAYQVK